MTDSRREMGDWQTPEDFALKCCLYIRNTLGFVPDQVIEPTCGTGNFISAARYIYPDIPILGMEINPNYVEGLRDRFEGDEAITIVEGDCLHGNPFSRFAPKCSTLVLGNPPWVTNSTLSSLESTNVPDKTNFKGLRGIEAMTGGSNFDICEWIILQALESFNGNDDVLAMLCKTSVARNVCMEMARLSKRVACTMLAFDSKKVFGISAAACLLVCDFRASDFSIKQANFEAPEKTVELLFENGILRESLPLNLVGLKGKSVFTWRQGVKHDCSRAMELKHENGIFRNKLGELVQIEDELIYPYIKSSKSRHYLIHDSELAIPMTQRNIGEDTNSLMSRAPKFWNYLQNHSELFDSRKSSIYKHAPRFAMFGVGDYSYSDYKVAVSGFYKEPVFSLAYGNKPIMFDDTCYFISFDNESDAKICMLLLNSNLVKDFYSSVAFLDSKRPYTKKVLSQLNFSAALESVGLDGLNETATALGVPLAVTESEFVSFRQLIKDAKPCKR